jgi:hypothetical protein
MAVNDPRFIFACLCWFGMAAILFGAAVEIREKLAGNALGTVHFWVRMLSATCWLLSLGLMSFAVFARWPRAGIPETKHLFAQILLAGLCFLVLAFVISFVDFVLFLRIRAMRRDQLADQMDQWIQQQIEEKENTPPVNKPQSE